MVREYGYVVTGHVAVAVYRRSLYTTARYIIVGAARIAVAGSGGGG